MSDMKSPESIAEDICREWKMFWMNQKQNNEADYKNYLGRAMGVDANMRCHLENLISQAIKAERESNRLILPERKEAFKQGRYVQGERDWNACLDEVIRLNDEKEKA